MPAEMHIGRREFVIGAVAAGLMALPGMSFAQMAGGPVVDATQANDVLRRLSAAATQRAFARLALPDGFYKSGVARFGMPTLFAKTGGAPPPPLSDPAFRAELQHRLNNFAEFGARGASTPVADWARKVNFPNPASVLAGRPTAATTELRLQMGPNLVNMLTPSIDQALAATPDPTITQAIAVLPGVTMSNVALSIAQSADNGIWYEIGAAEAEIRADPSLANDSVLAAALKR